MGIEGGWSEFVFRGRPLPQELRDIMGCIIEKAAYIWHI